MKKKLKRLLSLALAFVLSAAALAGTAGIPAEAYDSVIDTSGFHIPEPNNCYLYHWKPGLPPAPKDFSTVRYPLLITWKDQYFLCTDDSFAQTINYRFTDEGVKKLRKATAYYSTIDVFAGSEGWSDRDEQKFSMGKNALLSTLSFYQSFKNKGHGVTFDFMLPEIPYVCYNGWNYYALGVPQKEGSVAFDQEYNWLVAQRTHWDGKNISGLNVRHFSPEQFLDYDWSMPSDMPSADGRVPSGDYTSVAVDLLDVQNTASGNEEVNPDIFKLWRFWSRSFQEGKAEDVAFHSDGTIAIGHSKDGKKLSKDDLRTLLRRSSMTFEYDGSKFIAISGEGYVNHDGNIFQVYYGEPEIVSIHHDSFTVAKGQVVNLDGPIIIGTDCTVTVEDGGVLSCSGWVINAGEILIKPGGTLLVQERETKTGDWSYGAITNMGVNPGARCGRIACDGKMIVMRDCKVCGAGLYGLEFGEGAQVVNYGQIISENLCCKSDYTIENRGPDSAVYAGWGAVDGGYDLTKDRVYGSNFSGKGTVEVVSAVYLPANAVYGEGAGRVYINAASTVAYYTPKPQKGRVSDRSVLIEGEDNNMDDGHTIDILPEPGSTAAPKPTDPVVTGPTPSPKPTPEPEETFASFDGTWRAYRQKSTGKIYTVTEDGSILWYNEEYRIFEGALRNGAWGTLDEEFVDMSGVR